MKRHDYLCFLLALTLCSGVALPFSVPKKTWAAKPVRCEPTQYIKTFDYPGGQGIYLGNNLIQPKGKAVKADGQPLIIQGLLRDKNCVPISQAVVEIWQLDPFGKKARFSQKSLASVEPIFTGSGRTHSGTNGEFYFVTAIPGAAKKRAPRIHIRVKAPDRPAYSTQLFLGGDVRNEEDPLVRKIKEKTRDALSLTMRPAAHGSSFYGDITLTLPYASKYDHF